MPDQNPVEPVNNDMNTGRGLPYETPAIEEVVTPDKIEREVAFAGLQIISQPDN